MRDHDPLCLSLLPYGPGDLCDCGTIRVVRADEREKVHATSTGLSGRTDYAQVRSEVLADLRAKVESLRGDEWADRRPVANGYRRALDDVLALIDGGDQ